MFYLVNYFPDSHASGGSLENPWEISDVASTSYATDASWQARMESRRRRAREAALPTPRCAARWVIHSEPADPPLGKESTRPSHVWGVSGWCRLSSVLPRVRIESGAEAGVQSLSLHTARERQSESTAIGRLWAIHSTLMIARWCFALVRMSMSKCRS